MMNAALRPECIPDS